ncbi:RNA polymerase sigma-70 factor [Mucilaginibacter glaciei]|uniref:RNA polymerase sigma-70 factor n=1 Tax=Mucilaginibacter glaciei TaxID=2772109 RepID=A0A926S2Y5_9SPHI|nr:RNA polymerase sigma-70 factor [Mucilaginibacter glaciei]MBD1394362.1 RNA polymerase sigma-70 factor [Mucilaginibacter glaciei]
MAIADLLHRIQHNSDESAFNDLYKQQYFNLYRYAFSFLGDKEAAEEVVQDVLLKIWLGRHKLPVIKNVQGYLYVAVKNACLNNIRSQNSKQLKEEHINNAYYFQLIADPAQLLISKQLHSNILRAVAALPPKCKMIFKMVKEDGLSCNEVAQILELSPKTVFAQLAIAIKKLESTIK